MDFINQRDRELGGPSTPRPHINSAIWVRDEHGPDYRTQLVELHTSMLVPIVLSALALRAGQPITSGHAFMISERAPSSQIASTTRRAVLLGAAALAAVPHGAGANTPADLEGILDRAETGALQAPPVLSRARSDTMVDPTLATDCKQLTSLLDADQEALYELLPAARFYGACVPERDKQTRLRETHVVAALAFEQIYVATRVAGLQSGRRASFMTIWSRPRTRCLRKCLTTPTSRRAGSRSSLLR